MRRFDESFSPVVRNHVVLLTIARTTANASYRFAPPFLATIARGFDMSISQMGIALTVSELTGLASPFIGQRVDAMTRRQAMRVSLVGVGLGAIIAGAAPNLAVFTIAIIILGAAKVGFDVALGAWIADHVPWNKRSAVVGFTEISWALGMLVGVSSLGLITSVTNWRWAYAVSAMGVLLLAWMVSNRLPINDDVAHHHDEPTSGEHGVLLPGSWLAIASCFTLMGAIQCIFVTFGPFLEDTFGFTEAGLAAMGFSLGLAELLSSTSSARFTDVWGKQRSAALGAALMVPAALVIAGLGDRLVPALIGLVLVILGFEFAIVSLLPIGTQLVPGRRGRGMGLLLGAGTLGRAAVSIGATRLYDDHGVEPAAIGSALFATATALLILSHSKVGHSRVSRGRRS
ncbi:MAG: MFS transporter [Acidobacteria bacterium]|nr:MFS transporter [Acidobacteriota bacterium]